MSLLRSLDRVLVPPEARQAQRRLPLLVTTLQLRTAVVNEHSRKVCGPRGTHGNWLWLVFPEIMDGGGGEACDKSKNCQRRRPVTQQQRGWWGREREVNPENSAWMQRAIVRDDLDKRKNLKPKSAAKTQRSVVELSLPIPNVLRNSAHVCVRSMPRALEESWSRGKHAGDRGTPLIRCEMQTQSKTNKCRSAFKQQPATRKRKDPTVRTPKIGRLFMQTIFLRKIRALFE